MAVRLVRGIAAPPSLPTIGHPPGGMARSRNRAERVVVRGLMGLDDART